MNFGQRVLDALRHRGEFPEQRRRRRMLATLARNDRPDLHPAEWRKHRVTRVCRCFHLERQHATARYGFDWPCLLCNCERFRPTKVELEVPA